MTARTLPALAPLARRAEVLRGAIPAALIVAASSALAVYLEPSVGLVASALVFVLGVMTVGALYGLTMAIAAAFGAFLIYNFFLTEPFLSFRMRTSRDVVPLLLFNAAALIAGVMAGRLKDRERAAQRSNQQLVALLVASEALQSAVRPDEVAQRLAASVPAVPLKIFAAKDGQLQGDASDPRFGVAKELWHAQAPSFERDGHAAHLLRGAAPAGVLVAGAGSADQPFLAALANLAALALERATLSEAAAETQALTRSEELKTALLSSVSHDFRTPLAAIAASASSLIDYRDRIEADVAEQLLRGIVAECDWLNRYAANLLELSKLQAGDSALHAQEVDALDMLGAALQRARPKLGSRRVERRWPSTPVLVNVDAALFELVLFNVLDNAATYSDDGSRIEIAVQAEGGEAVIEMRDEGDGIPADDLERVFERFQRGARAGRGPRGSGLGLAIAKGFVEAFGGTIAAATPGLGAKGTHVMIRIPLSGEEGR